MRLSDRAKFYLGGAACVVVALTAGPALAQSNGLDRITDVYRDGANAWGPSLRNYAIGLFGLLATIEFVWSFSRLAIKGADFGEFASEFFTRLMFIMFFFWLMMASGEIAPAVVNSFREAGNTAAQAGGGSGGMRPSDIWTAGADMASRIMETDVGFDVPKALALILAALVLIVCFALMAAAMIIALVEGYIIMNAGVLLMGFGGSRWTKDIAVKTLTYAVSVGAKLFVIQILVGMAEAMVKGWTNDVGAGGLAENMSEILEIVGASVVMLALTFSIPNIVQGIVNGTSPGSHNALTAATGAVGAAVAGGVGMAVGAGMAGSGAMRLASEQMKTADASGAGPTTGLGRVGAFIGGSAANLAKGAANDVGAHLSGRVRAGNAPARIGAHLHDAANFAKAERERPAVPVGAGAAVASAAAPGGQAAASAAGSSPSPAPAANAAGDESAAGSIRPEGAEGLATGGPAGEPIRGAAPTPDAALAATGAGAKSASSGLAAAAAAAGAGAEQMTAAPVSGAKPSAGEAQAQGGTPGEARTAGQTGKSASAALMAEAGQGAADQMTTPTVAGASASESDDTSSSSAPRPVGAAPVASASQNTVSGAAVTAAGSVNETPTGGGVAQGGIAASEPDTNAVQRTVEGASASEPAAASHQESGAASRTVQGAPASSAPADSDPAKAAPLPKQGPAKGLGGALGRGTGPARTIRGAPPKKPTGR